MADFRANVKSATINMHKKEISVSFVMFLDDDNLERAKELAYYIGKGELEVSATTRQMSFLPATTDYATARATDYATARAEVLLEKRRRNAKEENQLAEE